MLFAPIASFAEEEATDNTPLVYDFTKLTVKKDLSNLNGSASNGGVFYVWEKADKADSKRQDFKGYTDYTGTNLETECHVWRRSDRLSGNLVDGGLKCPNDREMVINGLQPGSKVKIYYDASGTVTTDAETGEQSEPKKILWASAVKSVTEGEGDAAVTTMVNTVNATVGETNAVSGETTIASGAEIVINDFVIDDNHVGGYFGFKVFKNMIIQKVEITNGETTAVNNFEEEAKPVTTQPENLNGSTSNGGVFYVWEKADKVDSKRQDFKGYVWKEGLALPEECHVWRRSDRINGNVIPEGLKCPNDREMVINGLKRGSVITITYDASGTVTTDAETGEQSEPKKILWASAVITEGEGDAAVTNNSVIAKVNDTDAISGETTIDSEAKIVIYGFNTDDNHTGGYFGFKVFKGMVIKKIEIGYDTTVGIQTVTTTKENGACYDLQGRRVAQPVKGLYIVNGKKVVLK